MSPARARTWTARSGVERTNHEDTAPPPAVRGQLNCSLRELNKGRRQRERRQTKDLMRLTIAVHVRHKSTGSTLSC